MMGEAPKLTAEESRTFVRRVLARVDGRVPVVVGVSAPGFAAMGELSASVMGDGASRRDGGAPLDGADGRSIVSYYGMVAETLGPDTPFVLQDFPLSTTVQISPGVILKIVETHPPA